MPIYEYQCEGCEAVHEVTQKLSEPPMETCPDCGKKVNKLISRSSFHLKGSGWYNTDYRKPKGTPSDTSAPKAESAPAATPNPSKPKAS